MNKDGEDIVLFGKVVGAHGLEGEIRLYPYSDPTRWTPGKVLVLDKAAEPGLRDFTVTRVREHQDVLLLVLDGVEDRKAAEALKGLEVYVRKDELPPTATDEYYQFDLLGMEVRTEDGKNLGKITEILSTGGNDVYQVEGELGEVLIPAVKQFIVDVDVQGRRMVVRLLEGLLPERE